MNHTPEVLPSLWQRSLCRNKSLVVNIQHRINIVGINVCIVNISSTLGESYSRMFKWFKELISVEVFSAILLVGFVFLCLGELPEQSELCVKISHQ